MPAGAPRGRREGGHHALGSPNVRCRGRRPLPATGFFRAAAAGIATCQGQRTRIAVTFSRTNVVGGGRSSSALALPLAGGGRMVARRCATKRRAATTGNVVFLSATWCFYPSRRTLLHKVKERGHGPPTLCGVLWIKRQTMRRTRTRGHARHRVPLWWMADETTDHGTLHWGGLLWQW